MSPAAGLRFAARCGPAAQRLASAWRPPGDACACQAGCGAERRSLRLRSCRHRAHACPTTPAPPAADYAASKPNVWFVTYHQLIAWMNNPVPASQLTPELLGCGVVGGRPGTIGDVVPGAAAASPSPAPAGPSPAETPAPAPAEAADIDA